METEETNDFDFLRGKKINDMEHLFQKRLAEIEQKHIDYFITRQPKNESDNHDRLHNHYIYYQSGSQASFLWLDKSDLDQDIKNEAEKAFNEIFGSSE